MIFEYFSYLPQRFQMIFAAQLSQVVCFFFKKYKEENSLFTNNVKSRLQIRWVVESANARIKRFKYLERVLPTNQIPFIGDYIRIVCALSNRYFPPLNRTTASDADLAQTMKQRCNEVYFYNHILIITLTLSLIRQFCSRRL